MGAECYIQISIGYIHISLEKKFQTLKVLIFKDTLTCRSSLPVGLGGKDSAHGLAMRNIGIVLRF